MKQSDKRYWELSEKWLNGTITPEEQKEFAEWYNARQDEPLEVPGEFAPDEQALEDRMWQHIQQHQEPGAIRRISRGGWRRLAVAASIMMVVGAGVYTWFNRSARPPAVAKQQTTAPVDVQPGSDKAILTLPDGSTIVLDEARNGTLQQQDNLRVLKTDSGQLAYQASGKAATAAIAFHTLSIPRGGKYQLTLSDGTKVWLNAASGIRFPTLFTGKERVVEIAGEAYFEVAKNAAMPFRVKVMKQGRLGEDKDDAEITVLGTHFNVNAYADEADIKTTLLEGSVKVNSQGSIVNEMPVILKPGQQAVIAFQSAKSSEIQSQPRNIGVQTVDTEEVIAWKEGLFRFRKMNIETVMRLIARWYDVEVVYEGDRVNQHFNGTIGRDVPVSEVFKMLELTRTVHFEVQGKKIIVKPGAKENSQ